jgi:hypothetical protein
MRRNNLQLVPTVDDTSAPTDPAENLPANPRTPPHVLRFVPQSDEDVTPDDAA